MPSHLQLALLSKSVYFPKGGFVEGWQCQQIYNDENGLGAAVYINNNNEMVIAFRGTDTANLNNLIKNMLTTFDIVRGNSPNTVTGAQELVKSVRDQRTFFDRLIGLLKTQRENTLYLVGHSIGGTIAALVAYHALIKNNKKYHVVVFESAGIAQYIDNKHLIDHQNHFNDYFITYLADPNLINTRSRHIGKVFHVHIKPNHSTLYAKGSAHVNHAIDCVSNDIMRILLFLTLLNTVIISTLGNHTVTQNLSKAAQYASSYMPNRKYMPEIESNNSSSMLFYFFVGLSLLILEKVIKKILDALSRQHPIDALITEFTKGHGKPNKCSEIQTWPDTQKLLMSHVLHGAKWLNPFCHASILTLNKEQELHDNMIKNIEGYKVKTPR